MSCHRTLHASRGVDCLMCVCSCVVIGKPLIVRQSKTLIR